MLIYLSGFNLSSKKFNYLFGPIVLKPRLFNELLRLNQGLTNVKK